MYPFTTGVVGVERPNASGELDSTFGNGGGVTTAFSGHGGGYSVVVEPSGKIVVVGLSQVGEANHNQAALRCCKPLSGAELAAPPRVNSDAACVVE